MSNLTTLVVFITGTFIGDNCWDKWKIYFESKGYKCIAPVWPPNEWPIKIGFSGNVFMIAAK